MSCGIRGRSKSAYFWMRCIHSQFIKNREKKAGKMKNKAEKYTFVEYSDESKVYRLLDKVTNKIKISRDVIFLDKADVRGSIDMTNNKIILPVKTSHHENDQESFEDEQSEEESSSEEHSTEEFFEADGILEESPNEGRVQCRRLEKSNHGVK